MSETNNTQYRQSWTMSCLKGLLFVGAILSYMIFVYAVFQVCILLFVFLLTLKTVFLIPVAITVIVCAVHMGFAWKKLQSKSVRAICNICNIIEPSTETKVRLNNLKKVIQRAFKTTSDTEILISDDCEWSAVSIGKRVVLLNKKLLSCNDEQLQGYLTHEIAHQHISEIPIVRNEALTEFPRMLFRDFINLLIRPWLFITLPVLFWLPVSMLVGSRAASTSSRIVFTIIALIAFLVMSVKGIMEFAKLYAAKALHKSEKELDNSDIFTWLTNSFSKADGIKEKAMAGLRKFDPILLNRNLHEVCDQKLNMAIDQFVCSCGLGNELLLALENELPVFGPDAKLSVKVEYERYSKYRINIKERIAQIKSFMAE